MKKLFMLLAMVASHSAHAEGILNKYVTYCELNIMPTKTKLVTLLDGSLAATASAVNWVYLNLADTASEKYTPSKLGVSQYRVQFNVDGGSAKSLYDLCKQKLESKETISRIDVQKIEERGRPGEYIGQSLIDSSHQ